jgi:hypothetical protein
LRAELLGHQIESEPTGADRGSRQGVHAL